MVPTNPLLHEKLEQNRTEHVQLIDRFHGKNNNHDVASIMRVGYYFTSREQTSVFSTICRPVLRKIEAAMAIQF
jgi:hypothetical protein